MVGWGWKIVSRGLKWWGRVGWEVSVSGEVKWWGGMGKVCAEGVEWWDGVKDCVWRS